MRCKKWPRQLRCAEAITALNSNLEQVLLGRVIGHRPCAPPISPMKRAVVFKGRAVMRGPFLLSCYFRAMLFWARNECLLLAHKADIA